MNCSCDYDYEQPEFYRETHPVARKAHKCHECRHVIEPGETYFRASGKWDGSVSVHKMCQNCVEIRNATDCRPPFGNLREAIEVADSEAGLPLSFFDKLSPAAAEVVAEWIEEEEDE